MNKKLEGIDHADADASAMLTGSAVVLAPHVGTLSKVSGVKSHLRHLAQSAGMWTQALSSSALGRPALAIAPSGTSWDAASRLRAWTLAAALRNLGWRVLLLAPEASLAERRLALRLWRPDVLLLQQSRHPLNRPRFYPGVTCVFDQDDADYLDERVRREIIGCCEGSALVIAGSREVAAMLAPHSKRVEVVWTSTPAPSANVHVPPPSARGPIVAWAHGDPFGYPAELAQLQRVMVQVGAALPDVQFWMFGCQPDDPRVAQAFEPLVAAGVACKPWPYMNYARYLEAVSGAAVGLMPVCVEESPYSRGKSFGKVLAYLVGRVPVVASNNVEHPLFFESGRNGFLFDDDAQCAQAIIRLLQDQALRNRVADEALRDFHAHLSTDAVAQKVSAMLMPLIEEGRSERVRRRA